MAQGQKGKTMNANPINFGAQNSAREEFQSPATPATPSVVNPSAPERAALAHAERSYPAIHRPKSPSHAKLYDQEKQRCYTERLRIELENQTAAQLTAEADPSLQSLSSICVPSFSAHEGTSTSAGKKFTGFSTLSGRALDSQRPSSGSQVENNWNHLETSGSHVESSTSEPESSTSETPPSPSTASPSPIPDDQSVPDAADPFIIDPPTNSDNPKETTSSESLVPAETQDSWETHFDPTIPFEIHLKTKSPLARLNPEHQKSILALLKDHTLDAVVELLARPLPYGLNLHTSPAALSRFTTQSHWTTNRREREQKILLAQEILSDIDKPTQAGFDEVSTRLLKMRILANTSQSDPDLKELHTLINCYAKLRRTSLAERKQKQTTSG
jgi:hypothetical protein